MNRILVLLMVLTMLSACSKSGDDGTDTAGEHEGHSHAEEPVAMIPDEEFSEYEKIANAQISPFFDVEANVAEKAVAPGEQFDFYVFGQYNELYPMSAAEYKVKVPEGITVMSTAESDSTILSLGKWDNDFMIAFHCAPGPRFMIVKYTCEVDESFSGGVVETTKGADRNFIGFTMCDATRTPVRARGGQARLTRK
jgi:hypothetical protein